MQPWLLKVDKWCEDKLGIDLIVQDKKFHEKYPLVSERLTAVEDDLDYCCKLAHPKCGIEEFDGYDKLIERIERLEKNAWTQFAVPFSVTAPKRKADTARGEKKAWTQPAT